MLLLRREFPRWKSHLSQFPANSILIQVRRDWFAYSVLSALPWVGRELYEKKESELDRMLGSLEG